MVILARSISALDPSLVKEKKIGSVVDPALDPSQVREKIANWPPCKIIINSDNYTYPKKGPVAILNLKTGKKEFFSPIWTFSEASDISFVGPKLQTYELAEFMDDLERLAGDQTPEQRTAFLLFTYFQKIYGWRIAELEVPKPEHSAELSR